MHNTVIEQILKAKLATTDTAVNTMANTPNELVYLPRLDEDGYFNGLKTVQRDEEGNLLLPLDVVEAEAPCEDPTTADSYYKWGGAQFMAEKKPTTGAECVAIGPVSHESITERSYDLRERFQKIVAEDSEHYQLTRGDDLEWIVQAIPEKSAQEKFEEAAQTARIKRDSLIAETDYLLMADYPISDETRKAVQDYRQALRDVPEQVGFPFDIKWPEKPAV